MRAHLVSSELIQCLWGNICYKFFRLLSLAYSRAGCNREAGGFTTAFYSRLCLFWLVTPLKTDMTGNGRGSTGLCWKEQMRTKISSVWPGSPFPYTSASPEQAFSGVWQNSVSLSICTFSFILLLRLDISFSSASYVKEMLNPVLTWLWSCILPDTSKGRKTGGVCWHLSCFVSITPCCTLAHEHLYWGPKVTDLNTA